MNAQLQPFKRESDGQDGQRHSEGHRDAKGRFTYGHPGGPGRPPRATEAHYLHTLAHACPPERFAGMIEQLLKSAEQGNLAALTLVLRFLIGTPSVAAPSLT